MNLEEAKAIVSAPSDQAEIGYWTLGTYGSSPPCIKRYWFKYHLRTPWASLYEPPGADLVDEWQVFHGDHFSGRTDSKHLLALLDDGAGRVYWSEEEARKAALTWIDARIEHTSKELDALRDRRAAFL